MQRTITMTERELERSKVINMTSEKRLTQCKGAKRLNISERHFRRLLRRYREKGDANWPAILKATLPYVDIFMPSIEEILLMLHRQRYEELLCQ